MINFISSASGSNDEDGIADAPDDAKESSGDMELDGSGEGGDVADAAKDKILAKISSLFDLASGSPDVSDSGSGTPDVSDSAAGTSDVFIPDLSTKSRSSTPEMGLVTKRMRDKRRRTTSLPDIAGLFGRRSGNWQTNPSSSPRSPRLFGRRSEILRDHNSTDRDVQKCLW